VPKIRILIVDDQPLVREGLISILSTQEDMEVIGQAEDGLRAVELTGQFRPDIVLLDLVMPKQDGLTSIPILKQVSQILVLTGFHETEHVYRSIKAGAQGYILKDAPYEKILHAIREVASGEGFISPSDAIKLIHEIDHPTQVLYTSDPLTTRELETLKLIARGLSNQEIAAKLFVHERTIAKYVSSILNKLHLANRTQVALYALRKGLSSLVEEEE